MLSFIAPSPLAPLFDATMSDAIATSCVPGLMRLDTAQANITDNGDSYVLDISAPGVAPSDLCIEVRDCQLVIKGETRTAHHTHFVEHAVALPEDADASTASATSANGLLTVKLPKKAKEETRIVVSTEAMDEEPDSVVDGYFKVAFGPRIVVRATPELQGDVVRSVAKDAIVEGTPLAGNPNWIKLEDGSGFIMIKHEKHGVLLEPTAPQPYKLTLVTAGLAPADICVTANGPGLLTATGETARTGAKLHRRFRLPRDADSSRARATCVDGMLTIAVPKKAKAAVSQRRIVVVNAPVEETGDEKMVDAPADTEHE